MKCKQTVYYQNKVENIRIQTDCCNFFPLYNQIIEFFFSKHLLALLYWIINLYLKLISYILFLNEDVPLKKAKISAEGDFSEPSLKHHSFTEVFLVSLIINLMWGEKQDLNTVFLTRLSSILELYFWEELNIYRISV